MASKGRYNPAPEWWKHLKWNKRVFWKRERRGAKKDIKEIKNETEKN